MATLGSKVILFGGVTGPDATQQSLLDDTWEWDGTDWTERKPAHKPVVRRLYPLAYPLYLQLATLDGKVVLYVPPDPSAAPADGRTWLWDGTDWAEVTGNGPRTESGPLATLGSTVVLRANALDGKSTETWVFKDDSWGFATPYGPFLFRGAAAAIGNRDVFVGATKPYDVSGTWEWDGQNFTQRTVAVTPPARCGHAMSPTADGKVLLFGGGNVDASGRFERDYPMAQTWLWDGTSWTENPAAAPPGGSFAVARRDQALVLIRASDGPFHATWEWDNNRWTEMHPTVTPKTGPFAVAARGPNVLLLTYESVPIPQSSNVDWIAHTYEWDGVDWAEKQPARSPAMSFGFGLASRGANVAYLGKDETWEWDGNNWEKKLVANPPPRMEPAMATLGGKVVLFGGYESTTILRNDTWEWDGASWTQKSPSISPDARGWASYAMATLGNKVLLFGGARMSGGQLEPVPGMWEWDGTNWAQRTTDVPPARAEGALGSMGDHAVLFGGYGSSEPPHNPCNPISTDASPLPMSDMWIIRP
jgi:hypothetical protein